LTRTKRAGNLFQRAWFQPGHRVCSEAEPAPSSLRDAGRFPPGAARAAIAAFNRRLLRRGDSWRAASGRHARPRGEAMRGGRRPRRTDLQHDHPASPKRPVLIKEGEPRGAHHPAVGP
jgi:hypothetical protein